jgi:hypothetical protein
MSKPKGKRNVDSAAGARKLDCPGGVAELPLLDDTDAEMNGREC